MKHRGWGRLGAVILGLPLAVTAGHGTSAAQGPPRTHIVEIRGMAFQPAVLHAALGDTVTWVNQDMVPHTATGPAWDTGQLSREQGRHFVPREKGRWVYTCILHPTMKGTLIVQ